MRTITTSGVCGTKRANRRNLWAYHTRGQDIYISIPANGLTVDPSQQSATLEKINDFRPDLKLRGVGLLISVHRGLQDASTRQHPSLILLENVHCFYDVLKCGKTQTWGHHIFRKYIGTLLLLPSLAHLSFWCPLELHPAGSKNTPAAFNP